MKKLFLSLCLLTSLVPCYGNGLARVRLWAQLGFLRVFRQARSSAAATHHKQPEVHPNYCKQSPGIQPLAVVPTSIVGINAWMKFENAKRAVGNQFHALRKALRYPVSDPQLEIDLRNSIAAYQEALRVEIIADLQELMHTAQPVAAPTRISKTACSARQKASQFLRPI